MRDHFSFKLVGVELLSCGLVLAEGIGEDPNRRLASDAGWMNTHEGGEAGSDTNRCAR